MKSSDIIMDFTGVYKSETFYRNGHFDWIDCTHICGTDCYCDRDAQKTLSGMIGDYGPHGLHFIDSGDYHYMSKLWTDKIREPFALVVFDHHPDMQPSRFESLMSCGCWVKSVLDSNPFVGKVILVGADDALMERIPGSYTDRIVSFSEKDLDLEETWNRFSGIHVNVPVYISVDKDVLCPAAAATNWDQGTLTLAELKRLFGIILQKQDVIGIDICGECAGILRLFSDPQSIALNDTANRDLLRVIRRMNHSGLD